MKKNILLLLLLASCKSNEVTGNLNSREQLETKIDRTLIELNWMLSDCYKQKIKCVIVSVQLNDTTPQHLWRAQ